MKKFRPVLKILLVLQIIAVLTITGIPIPLTEARASGVTAAMTVSEGYYIMRSWYDNNYAVGVDYTTNNVCVRPVNSHYNEVLWRFIYMGEGLYVIENYDTKKFLDVTDFGEGTDCCVYRNERPQTNELWYVVHYSGSYYYLVPYCKQWMALDINNGIMEDLNNVHLWDQNADLGDKTQLLKLDSSPDSREEFRSSVSRFTGLTVTPGIYAIRSTINQNYAVNSANSANGTSIDIAYYFSDDDFLKWEFEYFGFGLYSIRNVGSNKYLDVSE